MGRSEPGRSAQPQHYMSRHCISLVVPGSLDQPTGGYRYDARIAAELRRQAIEVEVAELSGSFPDPDDTARAAMNEALGGLPDGRITVVDGLALGGLPEIARKHRDRLTLIGLVHHPLADETGLTPALRQRLLACEARALENCTRIVTTSEFTARRLADFGVARDRIQVVPPGVDAAAAREPADAVAQRLLCVGSLIPRKGQDLLVEALAGLTGFAWRLALVGDAGRDCGFTEALRSSIHQHGLDDRVVIHGVQDTTTLDATYRSSDVLIVPSYYEGFGMVVTEALARALPVIATDGGALVDTVPHHAGLQVPTGDTQALARALKRWFTEPELRAEKAAGAVDARRTLLDWPVAGRRFAAALALDDTAPACKAPAR